MNNNKYNYTWDDFYEDEAADYYDPELWSEDDMHELASMMGDF